ncbi:MAG TPA: hypothetical protein VEB42_11020, partial [Chitinophagaceae bacterium]|nr:hypothetical protein [Chitinophagaceae bacterium]
MNSLKLLRRSFIPSLCALLILTSCKKDLKPVDAVPVGNVENSVPAYVFDWETADYMPAPPAWANTIYVPWANGAVKGFPSDIWYDYHKADGWKLVYNVFDPTKPTLQNNPFFVLYNQYRGLLRVYMYLNTNGFVTSDYLTSGLNLGPNNNSTMLNFLGQDLIDLATNKTAITKIEGTQVATGVWYASEYEMAYDPNVAAATYQQLGLNWTLKFTSITAVDLGGTVQGTLKGTITT